VARWDDVLGKQAEALADNWVATQTGVDNDLVNTALSVAAYRGDAARFDRYLAAAKSARDRETQQRLIWQLGNFRDPQLAKRALSLILDGTFDIRDSAGILWGVLNSRENRDLGLAWVTEHIDEMLAKRRDDENAWFLSGLAGSFCDAARLKAAELLVTPRMAKVDGAEAYVTRSIEASMQCIARVSRQQPALKKFLKLDH